MAANGPTIARFQPGPARIRGEPGAVCARHVESAEMVETSPTMIGTTLIDRYRIERSLGEGGMAHVYLALDLRLDRQVAVKCISAALSADPIYCQRFLREARVAAKLEHDNVIEVYDIGQTDKGILFYVMRHLRGEDLGARLRSASRLGWRLVCNYGQQVARALVAAHAHGVIHRDIKPSNCFVIRRSDDAELVKVLDFGIARELGGVELTTMGAPGSPLYMAPEQARGAKADERTDVYAVGGLLYTLLTGQAPYPGESFAEIVNVMNTTPPPRPSTFDGSIPPELDGIVMRAIDQDVNVRHQTMDALVDALESFMAERARVESVVERTEQLPAAKPIEETAVRPAPAQPRPASAFALGSVLTLGLASLAAGLYAYSDTPVDRIEHGPEYRCHIHGDAVGCRQVGLAARADGLLDRAQAYFAKACAGGDGQSCSFVADALAASGTDEARRTELYDRACKAGAAEACIQLGWRYEWGHTVARDVDQAAWLFAKACEAEAGLGCQELGDIRRDRGQEDEAAQLLHEGCELGSGVACKHLAFNRDHSRDDVSPARAMELHAQSVSMLQAECTDGNAYSCGWLGHSHENGQGVEPDPTQALAFYMQACDGGAARWCRNAGELLLASDDRDEARVVELYARGCQTGSPASCVAQGEVVRDAGSDEDLALELFMRACDAGNPKGCAEAGALERDPDKAVALLDRACSWNQLEACSTLARAYLYGRLGRALDIAKAEALATKACDGEEGDGCSYLAWMYKHGRGRKIDLRTAASYYQASCDLGSNRGCWGLADFLETGRGGMSKDLAKAMNLYAQGCDGGHYLSCDRLATIFEEGRPGVERQPARALELHQKSLAGYRDGCEGVSRETCHQVGWMYEAGHGVEKDWVEAAKYYRLACDAGDGWGCKYLSTFVKSGLGGEVKDPAEAKRLHAKACEHGYPC